MSNIFAIPTVINTKLRISFLFTRVAIVFIGISFSEDGSIDEGKRMNVVLVVDKNRQRPT